MKTLIIERITELKQQRAEILDQLCTRGKNNNLSSDIIISEGVLLKQIELRISELEIMLHQAEHFYGGKDPNIKPKDNGSKK